MSSLLDEIIAQVQGLSDEDLAALTEQVSEANANLRWIPSPGPQTEAYFSEADELFYGGKPGGGKSDLGVGLSLTVHRRTLFLRRQREEAKEIADRYFEVLGTRNGWNGQDLKLRTDDSRTVDVGGCNLETDKQKYKGIPHDLKFFDEISDFTESQYRFIIIWNRSAHPGQRCRVICAGNPPTTPEGLWVIKYWGPWLDPTHPNPAKPGELRWYLGTEDGDKEVDGPGPYPVDNGSGKITMVRAKSRTFIPAELSDNPYLRDTNYESVLAGLTGDMRNAYFLGKFDATLKDDPKQVCPTSWVKLAQARWSPLRPVGVPMCAIGVDPTSGGEDECTLAPRYDGWFAPVIAVPAKQVPFGKDIAGLVVANRRNHCVIVMDMGGGYGNAPYEILKDNDCDIVRYEGYKTSSRRTFDGKLKFMNDRAEAYWRFREALDPSQDGGSPIQLPEDPTLVAELTAPKFKISANGIVITPKEELIKTLGHSPNRADAVVMSWWQGAKGLAQPSHNSLEQGTVPRNTNGMAVNMGRGNRSSTGVNFGRRG